MKSNRILLFGAICMSVVGVALAQNLGFSRSTEFDVAKGPLASPVIEVRMRDQTLATQIIGAMAYSRIGDELGRVTDLLLDESGQLAGIVVTVGGVFGFGGKAIGVPYGMIDLVKADDGTMTGVRVGLTSGEASEAPVFRSDDVDVVPRRATNLLRPQTQREVSVRGHL